MVEQTMIAPDDQRDLVIRFFACFSRFEYALKAAGWVCAGKGDAAEPDWNRVVGQLKQADQPERERVLGRAGLLLSEPPRKQVFQNRKLSWREPGKSGDESRRLIDALKRVRNNLFHGGKYNPDGVYLSNRAVKLIEAANSVLDALLGAEPLRGVAQRFRAFSPEEW